MTLGNRIKARRNALGLSQGELAKAIGGTTKQQNIAQLENDEVRSPRYLQKLLSVLEMTYEQAVEGVSKPAARHNVSSGPDIRGLVPVVSWVQAGGWSEIEDNYIPGDYKELLPCPASHGLHTFALRVEGDSMTSPNGRSYPSGAIIFVDPDQKGGITTGDRVVAKLNGDSKVTFKSYIEDGGKRFLKPLNPQYPIITDEFKILGKVIGMWLE